MAKQAIKQNKSWFSNVDKKLLAVPLSAFIVKLLIMPNIPQHYWAGADGENYINGLNALIFHGIFSDDRLLSYWPAGYALTMYSLWHICKSAALVVLVILQSALYAYASAFFVHTLTQTKFKRISYPFAFMLALNPTLSLSTLAIGYELIVGSLLLVIFTLVIRDLESRNESSNRNLLIAAGLFGYISFLQSRFMITGLLVLGIWGLYKSSVRTKAPVLLICAVLVVSLPLALGARNAKANGYFAISTNLGTTMNLGAGPTATGGFTRDGYGVNCPTVAGNDAEIDSALTKCVISWYLNNPTKTLKLVFNKSRFFWSPWSGPEASGSMYRNPWLKIDPLLSLGKGSIQGNKIVFGSFGKVVSNLWVIGQLLFFILGIRTMVRSRGKEALLGVLIAVVVAVNMAISIGTLGDHRQRLPILSVILFAQILGIYSIFNKSRTAPLRELAPGKASR